MFKYNDYDKYKKGGGSREPLPFIDKDPLFYLSSFQIPFREKPAAKSSGFFLRRRKINDRLCGRWPLTIRAYTAFGIQHPPGLPNQKYCHKITFFASVPNRASPKDVR